MQHCNECGGPLTEESRFCPQCGHRTDGATRSTPTKTGGSDHLLRTLRTELGDDYRVDRSLGRGGMAYVYLAQETRLDRWVAIKVLAPHLADEESIVDRFLREARTQALLNHPNIVTIHGMSRGDSDGLHYIVMEFMPGRTLRHVLWAAAAPLETELATTWVTQVGLALEHAHSHDVIHRDIKPANVLFDAHGNAHVGDFGIAKLDSLPRLTQVGMVVGTPTYMSPEQFDASRTLGQASDQYSLGMVAYEMLSGDAPFSGSHLELYRAHQEQVPEPLSSVRPEIPEEVSRAVSRMLEKDPADRFPSIGQAVAALGGRLPGPEDPLIPVMVDYTAQPTEVRIDSDADVTLGTGERLSLAASACGPDGRPLAARKIEWSSEDPDVVEVTPEGLVFGVESGQAVITASCEGVAATRTVTVIKADTAPAPASPDTTGAGPTEILGAPSDPTVEAPERAKPEAPTAGPTRVPADPPAAKPDPARAPRVKRPEPEERTAAGAGAAAAKRAVSPKRVAAGAGAVRRRAWMAVLAAVVIAAAAGAGGFLFDGAEPGLGTVVITGDLPAAGELRVVSADGEWDAVVGSPLELPGGDYRVTAAAAGFLPFQTAFTVRPGQESEVQVRLEPEGADPRGGVAEAETPAVESASPDGAARPGPAQGRLRVAGRAPGGTSITVRGQTGSWTIQPGAGLDLPVGEYTLEARAQGYEPFARRFRIDAAGDTEVTLAMERVAAAPPPERTAPPQPATGTLEVAGALPDGALLELRGSGGPRQVTRGGTAVPAGSYTLVASAPHREEVTVAVTIRGGEATAVTIPAMALSADARSAARRAVEAVVDRFSERDVSVTELLSGDRQRQYRTLLSNRTSVPEFSARLVEISGEPRLDGPALRIEFVMEINFTSGNRDQADTQTMALRLEHRDGAWVPASLELVQ